MAKLLIETCLYYECVLVRLSNKLKDESNSNNRATINFYLGAKLVGLFRSIPEK